MEIKKVKIPLLLFICSILAMIGLSDHSQYKQIGDTNFYLLPDVVNGEKSLLYHDRGSGHRVFFPISHEGSVNHVYWNQEVLIVKCCQHKTEHWYLMNNVRDYNYPNFNVRHFLYIKDYQNALDSLGIVETDMEHTDGKIPWRIHF